MRFFKKLFSAAPAADYKALVQNGALVLDVRTEAEFRQGHIKGALNIPVQQLPGNPPKHSRQKAVITCCASGMRSASAKAILKSQGFTEVYNGGSWMSLQNKIR